MNEITYKCTILKFVMEEKFTNKQITDRRTLLIDIDGQNFHNRFRDRIFMEGSGHKPNQNVC